tara:strand:+ start:3815 stop:4183 length:369 start_codon:yes stop_codon:yes gene_type:complete
MKKYNSVCYLGFTVEHFKEDASDITGADIRRLLENRLKVSDELLLGEVVGNLEDPIETDIGSVKIDELTVKLPFETHYHSVHWYPSNEYFVVRKIGYQESISRHPDFFSAARQAKLLDEEGG